MRRERKTGVLTDFGKRVKYRLVDLERTQEWLQEQVREKTGLFVDSSYMYKILAGQRAAPKIVKAISEILGLEGSGYGERKQD